MAYDNQNIFAKILRGEIPCDKVYEDDHVLAFNDITPQAPVHVLVIPKGAYVSSADFSAKAGDVEIAGFWRAVGNVARQQGLENSGYRLLANHGTNAGQEVPHFHVHIFGGRNLGPMLAKVDGDNQSKRDRLRQIIAEKSLKKGDFKLTSGAKSDIFFDMKQTLLNPQGINLAADLIIEKINEFSQVDAVGGLELGACPMVTAVCQKSNINRPLYSFYVRKDKKATGTGQRIEGPLKPGSNVIVFDDVTTKGGSAFKAVIAVKEELHCNVLAVITIVDREQGAREMLKAEGLELIPLFVKSDFT